MCCRRIDNRTRNCFITAASMYDMYGKRIEMGERRKEREKNKGKEAGREVSEEKKRKGRKD